MVTGKVKTPMVQNDNTTFVPKFSLEYTPTSYSHLSSQNGKEIYSFELNKNEYDQMKVNPDYEVL